MGKALGEAMMLLAVALVPAALAVAFHPGLADRHRAGLDPDAVRLEEVRHWNGAVLWVDARSEADFAADHVPGAVLVNEDGFSGQLGGLLELWTPEARVVVYCSSVGCGSSRAVAARLREAGMTRAHVLHGGWEAWMEAADP